MNDVKKYILEDIEKLNDKELGALYKFIRRNLIANIPIDSKFTNFKEMVLENEKQGNIVTLGLDGVNVYCLHEFIKQPTDGILYDLNRDKLTTLSFITDPKWVNDYASSLVIEKLKQKVDANE